MTRSGTRMTEAAVLAQVGGTGMEGSRSESLDELARLAASAGATVVASVGEKGSLASDFELSMDRGRTETRHHGEIGGGGPRLDLSTYKGSIELLDR